MLPNNNDFVEGIRKLLQRARRPEPIEQVVEAFDPIKDLLSRLKEKVIPLIEQQREPSQRRAMVAALEEDLRVVLKVLGDLENEARRTRGSCTELFRVVRKLRPRGKPRPPARRRPARHRRPRQEPTDEQKEAVLDALRKRGSVAMSELCYATGFGMARLKRILKALGKEGRVERSGTTSATRYRCTAQGNRE